MDNARQVQPAGWYPDPAQPGQHRWWTGIDWSDFTRIDGAANPAAVSTSPHETAAEMFVMNHAAPPRAEASGSLFEGSGTAVMAIAVSVAYLFVAYNYGLYLIGFIPAAIAYESFQKRERLAPVAVLAAAVALLVGISHLLA